MSAKHRYGFSAAFVFVAGALLAGCGAQSTLRTSGANPLNWIRPYRIDVIQGNFVSKEQVAQLKAGMTRSDVRSVMGTPLLSSVFHADRWDYVFTLKRQGAEPQAYHYTVYFKAEALERFEGDEMPSELEFIATLDNRRKLGKVPVLEATEEQLQAADRKSSTSAAASFPAAAASAPPAVPPTAGTYPPLEGPRQ